MVQSVCNNNGVIGLYIIKVRAKLSCIIIYYVTEMEVLSLSTPFRRKMTLRMKTGLQPLHNY